MEPQYWNNITVWFDQSTGVAHLIYGNYEGLYYPILILGATVIFGFCLGLLSMYLINKWVEGAWK